MNRFVRMMTLTGRLRHQLQGSIKVDRERADRHVRECRHLDCGRWNDGRADDEGRDVRRESSRLRLDGLRYGGLADS